MKDSRRTFMKTIAATGIASCQAGTLEGNPQKEHLPPVIGTSGSLPAVLGRKTGLKIKSIETFTQGTNLSIVRIRTDDGSEGYGQIAPFDADIAATVLHRKIARLGLGQDPADIDTLVDRCIEENYKFPWSFVCRALAGFDTAVWDLLGKQDRKSVCELLGGSIRPMAVYGSSMSRTIKPEDEASRLIQLRDSRGFQAFKIRVGKVCGRDQDQWPGRTEALIPAVRRAVGDKVALKADGNSCYTPPKAILVGRMLEANGYGHFEEPCPYWELEWTAQVADALKIPVAGGEQDNDLAQWQRMIRMHAVDIVQPDICYIGGVTRALRVAAMAAKAGMKCVPHSANLSLVTVFTLHVMGAIPNAGPHIEFTIESDSWTKNLYQPALEVRDGRVAIPSGPGWGVTISPEWLAKARREASE
ncbi:MAG TPA: mandelate racemase/muconate lactonizing enzyme family protein [Acidobacteriota bacterium]|nr:mandelate racemase/muconate lactonizing enzyme family protein [Acidobacteriota bacterium]